MNWLALLSAISLAYVAGVFSAPFFGDSITHWLDSHEDGA